MIFDFNDSNTFININVGVVKDCSFIKEYIQVSFGNGKEADIEQQLSSMGLKFSFKNGPVPFCFHFIMPTQIRFMKWPTWKQKQKIGELYCLKCA